MKQKYKDSDMQEFYTKRIYCKGMPEYSELTVQDKQAIANTLSFSGYMLGNAIDELKGSVIKAFNDAITAFIAFFDRSFNRVFHGSRCVKLIMADKYFKYNDTVLQSDGSKLRCLGIGWYVRMK